MKTLIRSMVITLSLLALAAWAAWAGNLTIPNPNFVAGTPAVADEVDANFAAVETEVDDNAADIAANDSRITDLENIQVVGNNRATVNSSTAVTDDTLLSTNVPVAGNLLVKICFSCLSFTGTTHTRWNINPRVDGITQTSHQSMTLIFPHADIAGTPGDNASTTLLTSVTTGNHTIGYYAIPAGGDGSLDCDISASAIFFPGSLSATIF